MFDLRGTDTRARTDLGMKVIKSTYHASLIQTTTLEAHLRYESTDETPEKAVCSA